MTSSPELSIQQRLIRYADMVPCKTAFIDARTPGSNQKENFCLIGEGVSENPDQIVHITLPHGFDVGAARQPKGCKNSHHSHNTEEVFIVHKGEWEFTWGENGEQGRVVLGAGDTISLPTDMYRGFENVGADDGMIFSVLGLNEDGTAGHVTWAPYVHEAAAEHGLILLEDGRLIDTTDGTEIPADGVPVTAGASNSSPSFAPRSQQDLEACILRSEQLSKTDDEGLGQLPQVQELAVIGCENSAENIGAGKMGWPHRFCVRRLLIEPGAEVPQHVRQEEEVLIVHAGELCIELAGEKLILSPGDLFTTPIGAPRKFSNAGAADADIIVVRRGDRPAAASFSA